MPDGISNLRPDLLERAKTISKPQGNGLNEAMLPDGLGQLLQLGLLEGLARVGGGLVNMVDGESLESAAVLHGALLWVAGGGHRAAHVGRFRSSGAY